MSRLSKGTEEELADLAQQIAQPTEEEFEFFDFPVDLNKTISTGSTLLDLAISGGRVHGGGIPGGIIMEVFGPSSTGKTQLMGEICASVQAQGGKVKLGDPEAKFDPAYAERYGFHIGPDTIYMPDTPGDVYREIFNFQPTGNGVIDCIATDSVAALIASAEMATPPEEDTKRKKKKVDENPLIADKMGGLRPKEIHALIRKVARKIKRTKILCMFTNQVHDSMNVYGSGKNVPGGHAIPYFATLRIELKKDSMIETRVGFIRKVQGNDNIIRDRRVEHEKISGIECVAVCIKNHIDDPFREAPLRIVFGYGFDDIGANLQWLKDNLALNSYNAIDKSFIVLQDAITHIEENNYEGPLREMVISLWKEIESKFRSRTKRKERKRESSGSTGPTTPTTPLDILRQHAIA